MEILKKLVLTTLSIGLILSADVRAGKAKKTQTITTISRREQQRLDSELLKALNEAKCDDVNFILLEGADPKSVLPHLKIIIRLFYGYNDLARALNYLFNAIRKIDKNDKTYISVLYNLILDNPCAALLTINQCLIFKKSSLELVPLLRKAKKIHNDLVTNPNRTTYDQNIINWYDKIIKKLEGMCVKDYTLQTLCAIKICNTKIPYKTNPFLPIHMKDFIREHNVQCSDAMPDFIEQQGAGGGAGGGEDII